MPKILHIITGLSLGGAETILASLLAHSTGGKFRNSVVSLLDEGHFGKILQQNGIPVSCLHLSRKNPSVRSLVSLRTEIQAAAPDLVHCWMYHPALMHGMIARTLPRTPVVWGIHHTTTEKDSTSRRTRAVVAANRAVAQLIPDKIVCCSYSTRQHHADIGFPEAKLTVILNGVDPAVFRFDVAARRRIRSEWGLTDDAFVVGHVGRYDPQKDHATLVKAAAIVRDRIPNARFVMCGANVDRNNTALCNEISQAGLQDLVTLLGPRNNVAEILSAFDVFVMSSSFGEALPVALLEAMSAQVVGIATDVGDCRAVISDPERIVPVRRPDLLSAAIVRVGRASPARLQAIREEGRARILDNYSLQSMCSQYEELYGALLSRH